MRLSLFFVACLFVLPACKRASEEDRVKAVIRAAVTAGNEKKAGEVVRNAAPSFKGPGESDVNECRRILIGVFLQNEWMHTFERNLAVRVEGDTAQAELGVAIARGKQVERIEDVAEADLDLLIFDLELAKLDGDWKF